MVMDGSGSVKFQTDYVPYGQTWSPTGSQPFMYTGGLYDGVTGLYLFGARFYEPTIGRFMTEDLYLGHSSDPSSLNRYVYAEDDPTRYGDPSGYDSTTITTTATVTCGIDYDPCSANPGDAQIQTSAALLELSLFLTPETFGISDAVGAVLFYFGVWGSINTATTYVQNGGHLSALDVGLSFGLALSFYPIDIGEAGEIELQDMLAGRGIETERGLWMNAETGKIITSSAIHEQPWVQMDLYSRRLGWLFDSKVGYKSGTGLLEEAEAQSTLLRRGFLNGISWISLANERGKSGWSRNLARTLLEDYNIDTHTFPLEYQP